jgi:hypothetical protein
VRVRGDAGPERRTEWRHGGGARRTGIRGAGAGRFADAIAAYTKAYDLSKAPAILFNVATIYDRKVHESALAIEYYRRALKSPDAEAEYIRKANERIAALKVDLKDEDRARSEPPPRTAAGAQPSRQAQLVAPLGTASTERGSTDEGATWRTAGLVVGAAGLASVGTALVLGLITNSKGSDANASCNASTCTERGVSLEHQAQALGTAATSTFVAGSVLLVAGVTMYFSSPRASRASRAHSTSLWVEPLTSPSLAGMRLRLVF